MTASDDSANSAASLSAFRAFELMEMDGRHLVSDRPDAVPEVTFQKRKAMVEDIYSPWCADSVTEYRRFERIPSLQRPCSFAQDTSNQDERIRRTWEQHPAQISYRSHFCYITFFGISAGPARKSSSQNVELPTSNLTYSSYCTSIARLHAPQGKPS